MRRRRIAPSANDPCVPFPFYRDKRKFWWIFITDAQTISDWRNGRFRRQLGIDAPKIEPGMIELE